MRQNDISRVISIEGFRIPPSCETRLENDEDVRPKGEGVRFIQLLPLYTYEQDSSRALSKVATMKMN